MTEKLITGFGAVRLFVSDLKRAVDFYSSTLGLELTAHHESQYAVFQLPNVTLLVERVDPGDAEFKELVGRFAGMSLTTGDIRTAYQSLSRMGVRFEGMPEKQFWGGTLAHFHDPDNNVLTLVEAAAAA
jgi:catechol 2,3-dioxygenase-like lactoylglutathione lyase family enzyme